MIYSNKGVSVLIGFILILLALTMFLGFLQIHLVPALCKDVELKHENSLLYSLYTINENLIEGKSSLIVFNLEVHYPKYPFLLFPPSMGCTLAVDKFIINITYDVLLPNGTWINRKDSINTARLIIYLNYFYNKGYMLVFENTAVFKTNGDKFIVLSDQKMFENEINIVGLNPTFQSLSSTEAVEVWLKPISYGGYVVARNIKVEFESVCPDYWLRLNGYKGYSVSVNGSKVEISYSGTTILKISYFLLTRGQYSYKLEPYNIIPTNPTTNYTLGVNQSILLGVKVIDRYNNPVRGEEINVTVSNESVGNVDLNKVYTDVNGNAYVVFTSNSTGSTEVVFKLNNKTPVVYNITVKRREHGLYWCYYDANTAPKNMSVYGHYIETLPPPNSSYYPNTPIDEIENIRADDGKYVESNTSEYYAAQRFVFKGLRNDSYLTIIRWNGKGVCECKGYCKGKQKSQGATIYIWNYTKPGYDMMDVNETRDEFWFNVFLSSSQLSHYINEGKMIILIVQNGESHHRYDGYARPIKAHGSWESKLYTDYICVIQLFK